MKYAIKKKCTVALLNVIVLMGYGTTIHNDVD
jgi:hypothetical protein